MHFSTFENHIDTDIFEQEKIVTEFNQFLANVDPILAKQIPESENTFESYLVKTSGTMQHKSVSINELRETFFSLKLKQKSRLWRNQL